jgi:hypothetical protein
VLSALRQCVDIPMRGSQQMCVELKRQRSITPDAVDRARVGCKGFTSDAGSSVELIEGSTRRAAGKSSGAFWFAGTLGPAASPFPALVESWWNERSLGNLPTGGFFS